MATSSQRGALLERHRYINVDYDRWWDAVAGGFIEDMKAVGITVDRMYFSGFASQGDGACFEGSITDSLAYLDHHHAGQYPMIRKLIEHGGDVYAKCRHTGRYYHEYCTTFSVGADYMLAVLPCPTEFHETVAEQLQAGLDTEVAEFETSVIEQWRTYMQQLYRKLEEEYDYFTSDEAVWETLEANELTEDDEGEE